jgi:hypothetical protein
MAAAPKIPTLQEIEAVYYSYKGHYNTLHDQQKEIDGYYELDFDAGVPEQYSTRMPPTSREWIDAGVRYFTLDNPKARVYLRDDNDTARKQASKLESLYNFWMKKDILVIKDAAKKLLLRGECFLKVNMDAAFMGSDNPERMFHFPLYLSSPDPINCFASPAHLGLVPGDMVEAFPITVAEAVMLCDLNGWEWDKGDKKASETVGWFAYTAPCCRCYKIDDKPILKPEVQPNLFGFCYYVHIGAGYGQSGYEGKPEYLYRSLLYPKREMLKLDTRTLSALDAINARYAFPRTKIKAADPEQIRKLYPDGKIPTDPNQFIKEIPGVVEYEVMTGEQPPPGLFEEYAMIQQLAAAPPVLAGFRPAGVYSAQHQESLIATAKPIYKEPFKNLEDGLAIAMGMGARIIEQVYKHPVAIKNFSSDEVHNYQTVKPADINGYYDCEVQLLAEPPEATDMRKALGKALRQAGSISLLTELMDYHDMTRKEAEDEIAQIYAEIIMRSPGVLEVAARDGMERMGMSRMRELLEQAQQEAAGGRITEEIPPVRQGQGLNMAGTSRRRQGSPELGQLAGMEEAAVGRELSR